MADGWARLADGMRDAGARLDEWAGGLDSQDRADGRLALLRALNNRLCRIEKDGSPAELEPFNGWRQKFFMDNPNYRYWITDIRDDTSYRISGNIGDSVYQSVTVYAGADVATAEALHRVDSDDIVADAHGDYSIAVEPQQGASSVWVRYVHQTVDPLNPGQCRIDTPDRELNPAGSDTLDRDLAQLGAFIAMLPQVFGFATAEEAKSPNTVRHWSAMSGGAAFTEPGIHYLRGGWQLDPAEVLLIDGPVVACRNWNIVLYNRFLNSLDYRNHVISHTGATATIRDGRYRFALGAADPGIDGYDWLDTQGRGFGLFVMRFLQPESEPVLPSVQVVR